MTYRRTRKRRISAGSSDELLVRYTNIKRQFACYLLDGMDDARPSDEKIAWLRWYDDHFHTQGDKAGQKIQPEMPKRKSNVTRIRRRMAPRT